MARAEAGVDAAVDAAVAGVLSLSLWAAAYSALRVVQARYYPEADPALVVWSTKIGMFWRMGQAAYVALVAFPLLWRWSRLDREGACRAASWAVPAAAVAVAAQGVFVP